MSRKEKEHKIKEGNFAIRTIKITVLCMYRLVTLFTHIVFKLRFNQYWEEFKVILRIVKDQSFSIGLNSIVLGIKWSMNRPFITPYNFPISKYNLGQVMCKKSCCVPIFGVHLCLLCTFLQLLGTFSDTSQINFWVF